jgi:hypothetical protein
VAERFPVPLPRTAVVVVLTLAHAAWAYRPFVSTDAAVAASGDIEVELGYAGFQREGGRTSIVAPTLVGNLGIVRDVELVAQSTLVSDLSFKSHDEHTRFEDTEVSLKWVAHEGALQGKGPYPSLAVELSMLLPTLRGQDRPGGELVGIASATTWGWTYHLNAGTAVDPGGNSASPVWGVILEHTLRGRLRGVAEVNGENVRGTAADASALVGAIWDVTPPWPLEDLSFDVGVRRGISVAAPDWAGTAGLTFTLSWQRSNDEGRTP